MHGAGEQTDQVHLLRRCTYAGRPFGDEEFVARMEDHFQRKWRRWSFEQNGGFGLESEEGDGAECCSGAEFECVDSGCPLESDSFPLPGRFWHFR